MKTYEKPTFTVVTLTANSAFCSCDVHNGDIDYLFGAENGCEFNENNSDIYCKFPPEGFQMFYS